MSYIPQDWSISALATELQMDRRTIGKFLADIEPCREDGRSKFYRMADLVKAIIEKKTGVGDPQREKARLDKLRADNIEHDLTVKRNEVIPFQDAVDEWGKLVVATKQAFLALPDRLTQMMGLDADQRETINREVRDCLTRLGNDEQGAKNA